MKQRKPRFFAFMLVFAVAALLFAGCTAKTFDEPAKPAVVEDDDGWLQYLVHETLYKVPKGWTIERAQGGVNYHYPPDGGMMMVMPASWGLTDMEFEDEAYDALYYYESRIEANFTDYKLIESEEIMHGRYYALKLKFSMVINDATVYGHALLYADASAKEVYQYFFLLPNFADSEIEANMDDIIKSIR